MEEKEQTLRNHKMIIAYDGSQYSGWQIQCNAASIQSIIQDVLKVILKEDVTVIGAGRTDAGVHALGQTAHFKCRNDIHIPRCLRSLNGLLPRDIRILDLQTAPLHFHAQHGAIGKIYYYHVDLNPVQNLFRRMYSLHVWEKVDFELLQAAAMQFLGTHDFTSFANEAHKGCASHDAVRTIKRLDLVLEEGGFRLEFEGDGFLYKMVRNIVGTLLEVATGKREPQEIAAILAAKDRRLAGQAAPPQGLFLVNVHYE